jgi:ribosome biogenesis GTPase
VQFPEKSLWLLLAVALSGEAQPSKNPSRDCKGAGSGDPRSEIEGPCQKRHWTASYAADRRTATHCGIGLPLLDSHPGMREQSISMARKGKSKSGKAGQKVRVAFRRNRSKPARAKDWSHLDDPRDESADALPHSESVVAKGDLSRKRTIIESDEAAKGDHAGIVVAMRGLIAEVDDGERVWPCTVRRILRTRKIDERNPVTVGDRVHFSIEADAEGVLNEGVIEAVEPRRGTLVRIAGRRKHVVAANVDQALIVASVGIPSLKPHLIDRYIVAAGHGEIAPIVCINKIDLDAEADADAVLALYRELGYAALATSAQDGTGIAALRGLLAGQCTAVAGQSGVGKSSLLNAVDPQLNLRVGEVIEETLKGRHTTTTAQLLPLCGGGYVVDTPGVKSFDLSAVPLAEIEAHFTEFAAHIPNCRFADCTHTHEIKCAVKQAVESGEITEQRYESYVRMFSERAGVACDDRKPAGQHGYAVDVGGVFPSHRGQRDHRHW